MSASADPAVDPPPSRGRAPAGLLRPTRRPRPGEAPRRERPPRWLVAASLAVAAAFASPLAYLVLRNLADPLGLVPPGSLRPLLNTVGLAAAVSATTAALGTGAAWLVERTDAYGRGWLRVLLPLPLVIPSFIGAFALIAGFAPGGLLERLLGASSAGLAGFWGAYVVLSLLSYPYVFLPVAARLHQLSPALEEAARTLGRSPRQVILEVVVPQLRGAVLAGSLLVFLYVVSDFGAVELLRFETLTRRIYATRTFDAPTSLALSLQLGLLALLVVTVERLGGGSRETGGERSVVGLRQRLGRWRPVATAGLGALLTLALAAPLAVLGFWLGRGVGRDGAAWLGATLADLVGPAVATARVSVAAAAASILVVLPVAYLSSRWRSRSGDAANVLVVAGFALPGLAIALALSFWTVRTPGLRAVYQTETLLVFAYVVHFGAQSLRAAEVAVASVPRRLGEAAKALGAGPARRLVTVDLPLMAPGLAAGAGLVLLSSMKELPATLLLSPPGFATLATRIWSATEDAFLAEASAASLLLVLVSGLLNWRLVIRPVTGGRRR